MTRVLVIGGAGMLGHKLVQTLSASCAVYAMVRSWHPNYERYGIFDMEKTVLGVDIGDTDGILSTLARVRPDVVVNCVGVIKQLPSAKDPIVSIAVNSLFPHRMSTLCRASGIRFVHISTDCVFDGVKGNYKESDPSNALDLYGKSKHLGEVSEQGSITLRTSIIGRELKSTSGLVEWFLSQQGNEIRGFKKAIFSGLTTAGLSAVIATLINDHPKLSGLFHVSTEAINKFDLLTKIGEAMGVKVDIVADEELQIDRSLDSTLFRNTTGISIPKWEHLIDELAKDATPYALCRGAG